MNPFIGRIINSLGEPTEGNTYTLKVIDGRWWIEHKHVKKIATVEQWLKSEIQKEDNPHRDEFEEFWDLYDKKKGKKKAWLEWKKLSKEDIEDILQNVPVFKTHFTDKQYLPYPRKYLYNRYWEDEDFQQPKQKRNGTKTKGDRRAEILSEDLTGEWVG